VISKLQSRYRRALLVGDFHLKVPIRLAVVLKPSHVFEMNHLESNVHSGRLWSASRSWSGSSGGIGGLYFGSECNNWVRGG